MVIRMAAAHRSKQVTLADQGTKNEKSRAMLLM